MLIFNFFLDKLSAKFEFIKNCMLIFDFFRIDFFIKLVIIIMIDLSVLERNYACVVNSFSIENNFDN